MLISFYHISLCPRCAMTRKYLRELLGNKYPASVVEINVLRHPAKALNNGVRMVPAIAYGDDLLSGLILSQASIEQFLQRNNLI